jgi:hypothetical protein
VEEQNMHISVVMQVITIMWNPRIVGGNSPKMKAGNNIAGMGEKSGKLCPNGTPCDPGFDNHLFQINVYF